MLNMFRKKNKGDYMKYIKLLMVIAVALSMSMFAGCDPSSGDGGDGEDPMEGIPHIVERGPVGRLTGVNLYWPLRG